MEKKELSKGELKALAQDKKKCLANIKTMSSRVLLGQFSAKSKKEAWYLEALVAEVKLRKLELPKVPEGESNDSQS